jgi:hypothetical protein
MDLQDTFYLVSIVFMLSWFVLVVILIIATIKTMKKMDQISAKMEEKMNTNTFGVLMTMIPAVPFLIGEVARWRRRGY